MEVLPGSVMALPAVHPAPGLDRDMMFKKNEEKALRFGVGLQNAFVFQPVSTYYI